MHFGHTVYWWLLGGVIKYCVKATLHTLIISPYLVFYCLVLLSHVVSRIIGLLHRHGCNATTDAELQNTQPAHCAVNGKKPKSQVKLWHSDILFIKAGSTKKINMEAVYGGNQECLHHLDSVPPDSDSLILLCVKHSLHTPPILILSTACAQEVLSIRYCVKCDLHMDVWLYRYWEMRRGSLRSLLKPYFVGCR